jgi:DNA invertase Pin-like site-specific DNA recombinase
MIDVVGENNPRAKMTVRDVRFARKASAAGLGTYREIATHLGVSRNSAAKAIRRITWRELRQAAPRSARFWSKVERSNGDGCWIYGKAPRRYGRFWNGHECIGAHRYVMQITLGRRLRRDEYVCHRCDTPGCVRSDHLFVGTQSANLIDARDKGRISSVGPPKLKGEECPWAKLSERDVKKIRELRCVGHYTQEQVAEMFGVSGPTISRIERREIWRHV